MFVGGSLNVATSITASDVRSATLYSTFGGHSSLTGSFFTGSQATINFVTASTGMFVGGNARILGVLTASQIIFGDSSVQTTAGAVGSNLGPQVGQNVYNGNTNNSTLTFRRLLPGTGMGLLTGSDTIMISFTGSAGGLTSSAGINLSSDAGLYAGNSDAGTLNFRTLIPGSGINFVSSSTSVTIFATITSSGQGSGLTSSAGINLGTIPTYQGVYAGNSDAGTLNFRSLLPGTGMGLLSGSDSIMISYTGSTAAGIQGGGRGGPNETQVAFWNVTNTRITGSNFFTFNSASLEWGMGTSSPNAKLHIVSNTDSETALLRLTNENPGTNVRTNMFINDGTQITDYKLNFNNNFLKGKSMFSNLINGVMLYHSSSVEIYTTNNFIEANQRAKFTEERVIFNDPQNNYNFIVDGVGANALYLRGDASSTGFGVIPNLGSRMVVSGGLQIMATASIVPQLSELQSFKLIYQNAGQYSDIVTQIYSGSMWQSGTVALNGTSEFLPINSSSISTHFSDPGGDLQEAIFWYDKNDGKVKIYETPDLTATGSSTNPLPTGSLVPIKYPDAQGHGRWLLPAMVMFTGSLNLLNVPKNDMVDIPGLYFRLKPNTRYEFSFRVGYKGILSTGGLKLGVGSASFGPGGTKGGSTQPREYWATAFAMGTSQTGSYFFPLTDIGRFNNGSSGQAISSSIGIFPFSTQTISMATVDGYIYTGTGSIYLSAIAGCENPADGIYITSSWGKLSELTRF